MGKVNTTSKAICTLPDPVVNGQKLTAVCGITNWGQTAWVLKSKGSASDNTQYPISIIKISKYDGKNPTIKTITVKKNGTAVGNIARHANSITYARKDGDEHGSLYITTGNKKDKKQIIKMDTSGNIEKEYYYYGPDGAKSTISTITYYGMINGTMMFITNGNAKDGRKKYNLTSFDGTKFQYYKGLCFGEETESIDYNSNDFTYSNGKLYHCFFKYNSSNIIKYNRIYVYDFSNINSLNGQIITADYYYQSNADSTYNKKYELEGVILRNNIIYAATNSESSNILKNKDTVFKLTPN